MLIYIYAYIYGNVGERGGAAVARISVRKPPKPRKSRYEALSYLKLLVYEVVSCQCMRSYAAAVRKPPLRV